MKNDLKFLISGVGGQGTVLASDILADVGIHGGYDVKKSDILGLAVRGGRWSAMCAGPRRSTPPCSKRAAPTT